MRTLKTLYKRSFALFLAIALCVCTPQFTVLAEGEMDPPVEENIGQDANTDNSVNNPADSNGITGSDADADSDANIDSDADADSDADIDSGADADSDVIADSDADDDSDADIDVDADVDSEAGGSADTGSNAGDDMAQPAKQVFAAGADVGTYSMPQLPEETDGTTKEEIQDEAGNVTGWRYTEKDENGVETRKEVIPVYGQDGSTVVSYKVSTTKIVEEGNMPQKPDDAPAVKDENGNEIEGSYQYTEDGAETVALPIRDKDGQILGYSYTRYDSVNGTVLDAYVVTTSANVGALGDNKTEIVESAPKQDESIKVEVSPNTKPVPPEGYAAEAEGSQTYVKTDPDTGKVYNWTWEEVKDAEGKVVGYVTRTTEITMIPGEVPAERPEGAEDITDGYQFTSEETLPDGTKRITVTRVVNGVATVEIKDVVETRKDFSVTEKFEGAADSKDLLDKPTPPSGYTEVVKDKEYTWTEPITGDNVTGKIEHVWTLEEIKDSQGNVIGYITKTTETEESETRVPNVPVDRPLNAVDIAGGYQYTTVDVLEDGRTRTTVTTVINGETITRQTIVTTTERRQEIRTNKDGSITVTMSNVTNGNKEPVCEYTTIEPDVKGVYDWKGYDATNDLYDREEFKGIGLGVITASSLNVRKGPSASAGKFENGKSLKNGNSVYIYEVQNGWYRIGENAWISADYVNPVLGTFQVNSKQGYVYAEANTNDRIASRGNGSYVRVDEVKTVGGVEWCHINSDGNYSGWIEKSKLQFIAPTPNKTPDPTMVAPGKELEHVFPDGYDYVYIGESGLESSIRVDLEKEGDQLWRAHQFILRDKKNNKLYVYCADFATSPQEGAHYKMQELDEFFNSKDSYFTQEQMQHINDIALNGYWGVDDASVGGLKTFKNNLSVYLKESLGKSEAEIKAIVDEITPGMALTATQAAIWMYGNQDPNKKINTTDFSNWKEYLGTYFNEFKSGDKQWTDVFQELDKDSNDKAKQEALQAVFEWLVQIDKKTPGANTTPEALDETNFATNASVEVVGSKVEVTQTGDTSVVYDANVSFAMKVTPSQINDDLIVTIYVDGVAKKTVRIAGENDADKGENYAKISAANGVYTIDGIELSNGAKIDIVLTGTQDLGNGVYIFASKDMTSQTFIGLSEGHRTQEVNLSAQLVFNVTEAKAVVTTTYTESEDPGTPRTWSTGYSRNEVTYSEGDDDDDDIVTTEGDDDDDDDIIIPEDPTPLIDVPAPVVVDLLDEAVPLAGAPELVDLFDEDVPLANVPETGDISMLWYVLIFAAGGCLLALKGADEKKRKNR